MFYTNKLLLKSQKNYKISYSAFSAGMSSKTDENLLPHKLAKLTYNFKISNGALKTGLGFSRLEMPISDIENYTEREMICVERKYEGLWLYPYYNNVTNAIEPYIFTYGENGQMFYMAVLGNSPLIGQLRNATFTCKPNGIYYRLDGVDSMIFTSADGEMQLYQGYSTGVTEIANAPKLINICQHYERMFAICEGERKRLRFSANLNPTNWTDGDDAGFIDMLDERGAMTKVLSFNDYVYVFREFGITRLSAYGDQEEFTVDHLYLSSNKIFGGSVCACGDKVFYLASDGLYSFNGSTATRLDLGIEKYLPQFNNNCCACFYKGKYYLALKMNFNDNKVIGCESESGYINNVLLELDTNTGELFILRGVDISSMLGITGQHFSKLIATFNGANSSKFGQLTNDGCVFGSQLPAAWISPKSNLSYANRKKLIKELYIMTKSPCRIDITTDSESKTYFVEGKPTTQRVRTSVEGELVEIAFESTSADAEISLPEMVVGVV